MKINLIDTLPKRFKPIAKLINIRECESELSTLRIGQELTTNLLPKSIFARGLVDLCDNAFREILEVFIVYVGPKILGENVFRKLYSKGANKGLDNLIPIEASKLIEQNIAENKKLMPLKAAIAVSALAVPLAEYSLSYAKNLFTLKLFKQADFNNIANLNKNKKEDIEHQKQVKKNAKKHIKIAGIIFAGCLVLSTLLATRGKNSKFLNHISETILAPGSKFFKPKPNATEKVIKKLENRAKFFDQYFGLDFKNKNGKLALSNGQVTACVVAGGFGYAGAAKDRGKQDFKEVMYRFPLVGFYAISGSDLVEHGYKKILTKNATYKNIMDKDLNVKKLSELEDLAKAIAKEQGKEADQEFIKQEFRTLFKQKSRIVLVPLLFALGFMGFFVAGLSRYFTQYRYNKEAKKLGGLEV